jgi:16S rRNA (guanine527-N7)-methyltransferase
MENRRLLREGANALGIYLSEQQIDKLMLFSRLLREWNERINLTAITDEREIIVKHYLDSLTVRQYITEKSANLIDIGTGGGFPGIPLKLCMPELRLSLLDATAKKVKYLETVCRDLQIDAICINARAEKLGHDLSHREKYDYATVRAVADLAPLAEYSLPLLKIGGRCLAQKGKDAFREAAAAKQAVARLGGIIEAAEAIEVPFSDFCRTVIIIKKVRPTPLNYPRKPGLPQKKPLE